MRRRRRRREPVRVADRLDRIVRPGANTSPMADLRTAWAAAVGAEVARNSTPLRRTRAGVVTIACSDGTWAQELNFRHDQLIVALQPHVPTIALSRLRFSISPSAVHAPPSEEPPARAPRPPGKAAKSAARELTRTVGDPTLRALLERAASHGLERNRPT